MQAAMLLCLAALAATAGGRVISGEVASERASAETRGKDLDQSSQSPVQRVVKLLRDMKAELEGEASKESEMYDKMVCWCETGEKDKTAAIAAAEVKISDLEASIQSMSAKFGEVSTNIAALKNQIAKDTEMLKEATAIREREASEFRGEGHGPGADEPEQRHRGALAPSGRRRQPAAGRRARRREHPRGAPRGVPHVRPDARRPRCAQAPRLPLGLAAVGRGREPGRGAARGARAPRRRGAPGQVPPGEKQLATRAGELGAGSGRAGLFLQASAGKLLPTAGSYSPQSDTIFGILTQMKDEFEANLSQEQKEEAKAIDDYEALRAAKEEQIAAGKESLDAMEGEHAANIKALSDAKEDLQLTTDQRSEDRRSTCATSG
ncbi:unnamed protein product [Prorocentrum cordatum]|uniref:Uncharacterized protein n=1 Tax=Prorocentrum cordatum TaxID=2364126 RepID=A0ABN9PWI0_9DINO|nr:unnamed protein product [Polarella glacialis]